MENLAEPPTSLSIKEYAESIKLEDMHELKAIMKLPEKMQKVFGALLVLLDNDYDCTDMKARILIDRDAMETKKRMINFDPTTLDEKQLKAAGNMLDEIDEKTAENMGAAAGKYRKWIKAVYDVSSVHRCLRSRFGESRTWYQTPALRKLFPVGLEKLYKC